MSEKVLSKEQVASVQRFGTDFHHEATVDEGMVLGHWHGSKRGLTLGDVFDSHEALRAERDAYKSEAESHLAGLSKVAAERDAALAEVESLKRTQETDRELLAAAERNIATLLSMANGGDLNQPVSGHAVGVRDALAELAEIKASYRATIEEPCDAGQVHCTCVPALRAEVERMRPVLRAAGWCRDAYDHDGGRGMSSEYMQMCDALNKAVDTFRARAQKEGKP